MFSYIRSLFNKKSKEEVIKVDNGFMVIRRCKDKTVIESYHLSHMVTQYKHIK